MRETLSPEDVERMAADAGLSIADLCKKANVAHTTFYRWRLGASPRLDVYERIVAALRKAEAA